MRIRMPGVIATAVLLSLMIACGSAPAATVQPAAGESSLPMGSTLPTPKGKAILTLSGVAYPNAGQDLKLDLATLDEMPTVDTTVFEPFLKRDVLFEGVLLSDLMGYAGVDGNATMTVTALDDYEVVFPLDQMDEASVLVATRADGAAIDVLDGGPTRFIFLDGSSAQGANTDNWVWSLAYVSFTTPSA